MARYGSGSSVGRYSGDPDTSISKGYDGPGGKGKKGPSGMNGDEEDREKKVQGKLAPVAQGDPTKRKQGLQAGVGTGRVTKAYRYKDPEQDRQRRLGAMQAASGLGSGAALTVAGRESVKDTRVVNTLGERGSRFVHGEKSLKYPKGVHISPKAGALGAVGIAGALGVRSIGRYASSDRSYRAY